MTFATTVKDIAGNLAGLAYESLTAPLRWLRSRRRRRAPVAAGTRPQPFASGVGWAGRARSTESLHLLSAAVEAAANGIVITDHHGVILWINQAFTQITGYSGDEIVGQTPRVLKSGQQGDAFYRELWETIRAGRVWHGELFNRHRDGHVYVEEQTIAPVRSNAGDITHFIGIKQDITQRQQYEEAQEKRNVELVEMTAAVSTISASLNVDLVVSAVVNVLPRLLPQVSGATVQMLEAQGLLVTRSAASGLTKCEPPMQFAPGYGLAGLAYRDQVTVNSGDVAADPRFAPSASTPVPAFGSLVAVPISAGRRTLGVLSVESGARHAFDKHEERLLTLLAGAAGVAIRHAIEYEGRVQAELELTRYSEQLETMVDERTALLKAAQVKLLDQQRLEQEVVLAAQVQASILPHRIPDVQGYEFAGVALAARYVSGDMYDWISFSPDHCSLVLADIAGKGVPAAMMTSTARALLRYSAVRQSSPGRTLSNLNRFLYDDLTHAGMFITIVAANLDGRTGVIDYASAGHTEAIWYRAGAGVCERLPATGLPVGVLPRNVVKQTRLSLCPGDILVLYSDGVTEAESEKGELFGTDRLTATVSKNTHLPAAALAQSIVREVDAFAAGPRSDDLTMIVLKAMPRKVSFVFPGDFAHMAPIIDLVRTLVRAYGDDFAYQFELAASEVVTNIIEHAYRDGAGDVRGEVSLGTEGVQLDLYDDGLPFDMAALPVAQPSELSEGGYGVHIVRQLMSEISYAAATDAGNHWRLVKTRRMEGSTW